MTLHEPPTLADQTQPCDVCHVDRIQPDRGVAALVDGHPVAVFRLSDGRWFAIDHVDPFSGSPTLARGMVGSDGETVFVAAPLHKQRFDLASGRCLDDPDVAVATWQVEVVDDRVRVGSRFTPA